MLLRMAALGEGVVGIMLKKELHCGYKIVLGPVEYFNVNKDTKGDGFWGDYVSRAGTSVRILALIAICV